MGFSFLNPIFIDSKEFEAKENLGGNVQRREKKNTFFSDSLEDYLWSLEQEANLAF